MATYKNQYFIIEEQIPSHDVYFSQKVYTSKTEAVKAAKAEWNRMNKDGKKHTIMAVYGWLGINGTYNPNTADEWKDPDVVINIAYGPHE